MAKLGFAFRVADESQGLVAIMNMRPWRRDSVLRRPPAAAIAYGLSLTLVGVYWNFYAVSSVASRHGWNVIEGFVGAGLAVTVFLPLLQRMVQIAKRENIESLADFIAARYGKSRLLGLLTSLVALVGIVFYIAQQLQSLSLGWMEMMGLRSMPIVPEVAFAAALITGAIFVGARRPTFTSRNPALVNLAALDGIAKLVVVSIAALACLMVVRLHGFHFPDAPNLLPLEPDAGFFGLVFLLTGMAFCMPHLFHMVVVESERDSDLKIAGAYLPLYFLLCLAAVAAIFWAGTGVASPLIGSDTAIFEILRRLLGGSATVAILLTSFFTASVFVIISASSTAAMLSGQIPLQALTRTSRKARSAINVGRRIMQTRRIAIAFLILGGWAISHSLDAQSNTTIGLLSLSLLIQLLPAIVAGVTWRRAHVSGAAVGLCAGVLIWTLCIAGPLLHGEKLQAWFSISVAASAPVNAFFQRFAVSILVNAALLLLLSLRARQRLIDRIQAAAFIDPDTAMAPGARLRSPPKSGTTSIANLKVLLAQFLGEQDAATALGEMETRHRRKFLDTDVIDPEIIRDAESVLSGVVGASLAASIVRWQLSSPESQSAEIMPFLEQTAQAIRLNREMLQATLNNLSQGVCVVDKKFQLVAWNARYLEIFDLGPGVIRLGTSLADIIRINRSRSGYSADDTERYIRRRLRDVRLGVPHVFERTWSTGKTLRVIGLPMSDGRYVTSFTDITSVQDVVADLRHANQMLEERVRLRTAELTRVNEALKISTLQAERARASQARFLAAASHDLLQPLHAARLFLGALQEQIKDNEGDADLARSADVSIESANRLLNALLNLSRLEVGGLRPEVRAVDANLLLQDLKREFTPVARSKGLNLRVIPTKCWVLSDEDLLRSILQNLIGNAVRYTAQGAVLVLCRMRGGEAVFEVRDSGPGIPQESIENIFEEYVRLPNAPGSERGMGLGLSIVNRICSVLGHRVAVRTALGKGTAFAVAVAAAAPVRKPAAMLHAAGSLAGLTVLCVEDDNAIRKSLETLLRRWNVTAEFVDSAEAALAKAGNWDVILTDYHFDSGRNGLDLIAAMAGRAGMFALITAEQSADVMARAAELKADVIRKPVAPATLRLALSRGVTLKAAPDPHPGGTQG